MKQFVPTLSGILMLLMSPFLNAQCNLVIDSVIQNNVSCFGQSDGSIIVYASGNTGAVTYSNGSGGTAIVPEVKFDATSELSTAGSTGPTNKWWSPSTSTGGIYFQYASDQGCPAGSAKFTGGFNGYAGSFLRSPQVNMTGIDQVTVKMDVTHGFNAARPNDNLRFYIWINNGFISTPAKFTVNGVSGNTLNFNEIRDCATITVTIDLSAVDANKRADFLFYIEANCKYNTCSTYQVSVDNINISQSGTFQLSQTFSGLMPGSYPITVKDASGCSVGLPTPVLITEPALVKPEIGINGAELSTEKYASYQWFLDGNLLDGATEQQYIITGNGDYTVNVVDSTGCGGISEAFTVLTTGLKGHELSGAIGITPNPFNERVLLQWPDSVERSIEIFNLSGQLQYRSSCKASSMQIPTEMLSSGIYLLRVMDTGGIYSKLLVKSTD